MWMLLINLFLHSCIWIPYSGIKKMSNQNAEFASLLKKTPLQLKFVLFMMISSLTSKQFINQKRWPNLPWQLNSQWSSCTLITYLLLQICSENLSRKSTSTCNLLQLRCSIIFLQILISKMQKLPFKLLLNSSAPWKILHWCIPVNAALFLMIIMTAITETETMDIVAMDVETADRMNVANKIMIIIAIIMTMTTSAKIINRLQMMIVTFTNISATRTTNGKIVYLIQHQTHIKSDMNPFSNATYQPPMRW